MKSIAIIPARGGSKRIHNKNIVEINGRPMLSWTVEACVESGCFSRVLVSTDSEEIARIATQSGADCPFLRDQNADDKTPASEATIYALGQAESYWEEEYCCVAQLMPNCPLRNSRDVQNAMTLFESSGSDSQISAFRFGWMNPWWSAELTKEKTPKWLFPEALTKRSQDLPDLYCPSGAIWISRRDSLLRNKSFYTESLTLFPLDWISAVDIDDAEDMQMAEACFSLRTGLRSS